MQKDDLVHDDAMDDLGDRYESYPECEKDAAAPEQVSVGGDLLPVACLVEGH